ncbi:MAG: hypothetical protein ACM3OO_13915 [Planctomycetaceae bacterium]
MSDRDRKRGSGYRAPAKAAEPASRGGFLDSLFAPRVPGASPMPKIRTTFARGFALVVSTPALVAGVPVVGLIAWLAFLAAGFQGPFSILSGTFAYPPVGTYADGILSASVLGGTAAAQLGIFLFAIVRAILLALVATISVERLRTGAVSRWALLRGLRILPVTITVNVAGLALLIAGNLLGAFLGPGLGLLAFVAAMVAGTYLFAFAPAIAADEDRPMPMVMSRSVRAARMPGSGNLTLASIAVVGGWAFLVAPLPGSTIGVNPSAAAWAFVLVVNLLHVALQATFAYRYLVVAHAVPEAPVKAQPERRAGAAGRRRR